MITINSYDEERYVYLKNANLKVIPWDKNYELSIADPKETISHALRRFATEYGIIGKEIRMEGILEKVRITKKTIGESIAAMRRQQADLLDLGKMFTVLETVLNNAVLIEVEPFRYTEMNKAMLIDGEYQYLSAFHDCKVLYPVKITVERYKKSNYTNAHVIITVGKIALEDISMELKRSVAYIGVHPLKKSGESLFSEDASFVINIQQLVKLFNISEGIIIKNFPNAMLSEEQQKIKEKIRARDLEKIKRRFY